MTSSLENAVLEEYAKFEGYKELLEDDLEEQEPDQDVFNNARENQKEFKKQYLCVKVAQSKYKAKLVPAKIMETALMIKTLHILIMMLGYLQLRKTIRNFIKLFQYF